MPIARCGAFSIAYELDGPADGEPMLLVHGVGAQLVRWSDALLDGLASRGFRTIRFDNRDAGLSTHLPEGGTPDIAVVLAARRRGEDPALSYTLDDLADDAMGLLDALGIDEAHVVGVSLGGMIAQQLAIARPERVRSLAIVMSQSGHRGLPPPQATAIAQLASPAPDPARDREAYLAHSVALNRVLGSPGYPTGEAALRHLAAAAADRAYDPPGAMRQMAAGRASPDRSAALAGVRAPTLVIHGADDPLIPAAAGEQLAETIPNASLLRVAGMGHDLPDQLCDLFAAAIAANARRAAAR